MRFVKEKARIFTLNHVLSYANTTSSSNGICVRPPTACTAQKAGGRHVDTCACIRVRSIYFRLFFVCFYMCQMRLLAATDMCRAQLGDAVSTIETKWSSSVHKAYHMSCSCGGGVVESTVSHTSHAQLMLAGTGCSKAEPSVSRDARSDR